MSIYDYDVLDAAGNTVSLSTFKDKVLVIVNVASKCGFTPQYEDLQALYEEYNDKGFEILGFPSNQFMNQEPGTNDEIQSFCKLNYGVSFPVLAKIDVNGENENPLYTYLKQEGKGLLGSKIKWNFTKFLIDRKGNVVKRYAPNVNPMKMKADIENIL
ncbi:glutathione peroxidase [Candidatus Xianfuyuplasma coldseepsis]|uniref:Glutathione peroxidase n=1 Tax=Candidatus Xianfuyuplasma coldseepsis TaxID=2782163 RepID=A0A7L7KQK0_9MOLU|nr:glutathione peroxidase [Xianfuyuplasma coldseepsis]QMS85081.1 glutathione peroxidase [Xianfuyuplasma coldseepsis]